MELFIRRVPDGALSSRLWALPIGARVRVGQPKGLFVLDEADRRPRIFIGTGTGLAPLLAMLEAIAERGDDATSVLVHGVSYRDELAYGYRIASWMATGLPLIYRPTLSRPDDPRNEGWRGFTGRADTCVARVLEEMPMLRTALPTCAGMARWWKRARELLLVAGLAAGRRARGEIPRSHAHAGIVVDVTHKLSHQGSSLGADGNGGSRKGLGGR